MLLANLLTIVAVTLVLNVTEYMDPILDWVLRCYKISHSSAQNNKFGYVFGNSFS